MPDKSIKDTIPPGFTLRHTLRGHKGIINRIAWSPDGRVLASGSFDHAIRLWDVQTGQALRTLKGHSGWINRVTWSPDGRVLASSSNDRTIYLWNPNSEQYTHILEDNTDSVS